MRGDVAANVERHLELVHLAVSRRAEVVVFPELSLTGYEPALARELALGPDDPRLDGFQELSDARGVTVAAGAPTRAEPRPRISLVIFRPRRPRSVYSKHHLHADEEPFFARGERPGGSVGEIALAICYELFVPEHAEAALSGSANVYLASAAKTAAGVERAAERLSAIARQHGVFALLANCVGPSGDGPCAGGSAAWNRRGECLARLGDVDEGLLLLDTASGEAELVPAGSRPGGR